MPSAVRVRSISQTAPSFATTRPPKMSSSASPTEMPSARLTTNRLAATGLAGAGSTPNGDEQASSGSENSSSPKHHRPHISEAN